MNKSKGADSTLTHLNYLRILIASTIANISVSAFSVITMSIWLPPFFAKWFLIFCSYSYFNVLTL